MMTFAEPKLEIVKCDNGYVVEWRDENRRAGSWPQQPAIGVKIFTSKRQVIDFLKTFFGDD